MDKGSSGRLGIWGDTWRLAGRFPIAGTGLNTYGAATLFYQTVDLKEHLAEAHNDYLQLLAEGGALVSVESSDYWIRIGAVTGILAIALQEISDFSLQKSRVRLAQRQGENCVLLASTR